MPRADYTAKLKARQAEAEAEAKKEARLNVFRANAVKARAAKAKKREDIKAGLIPEPERKPRKLRAAAVPATPTEHTLPGRIDLMLAKLGRTRHDMQRDIGVTVHTMQALTRGVAKDMRPSNLLKTAEYLGVEPEWLKNGPEGGTAAPVPTVAKLTPAARLNGNAPQGKVDMAMRTNLHSAMASLWGLMPVDVQVMIVSKMAELLAQQAHAQH